MIKFIVRFFLFLCLFLSMGHGHLKAISPQYDITRTAVKKLQDTPRTDHCRIKPLIVRTSPFRKDKEHNEIEIPASENREEDETEDDEDEHISLKKSNYFTTFFYSATPAYFSGFNQQYFSFFKGTSYFASSRCIVFQVFRI